MSTNTNNFNYYSDYQWHGGVHIIIIVILVFSLIAFGSSINKDKSNNSSNSINNNSSIDNNNNSINNYDDGVDDIQSDDNLDNNESSGKMFEYYKG